MRPAALRNDQKVSGFRQDGDATLRRVVFGFKIFGRFSGHLIEVDVDAVANAAAIKMVLLPLLYFDAPAGEVH